MQIELLEPNDEAKVGFHPTLALRSRVKCLKNSVFCVFEGWHPIVFSAKESGVAVGDYGSNTLEARVGIEQVRWLSPMYSVQS
jgi:hypothetical protein